MTPFKFEDHIRDVPDFPKQGIVFKDITPLLKSPAALKYTLSAMAGTWRGQKISKVASMESRGFIFGAAIAAELGAGFIPIRKKGKLPYKTVSQEYELEYGRDILEVHADAVEKGEKVLIVDDVLATGGTARAVCSLLEKIGAEVAGLGFLIELTFLKPREKLDGYLIESLI
ncbi:MAG: adenine phosphoribosyltransferase, partial [Endomicrobiia bacterium]|nr:adenine phosphoribosyltransferase [Endomicrobiia bacterium]